MRLSSPRRPLRLVAIAIAAVIVGMPALSRPTDTTWVLCFENRDIPPWRFVDGRGHNMRLLDAAASRAGVRLRYVARPWRRCQSDVAAGLMDGMFAISHSEERARLWAYPPGPEQRRFRMFVDGYTLVRRRGDTVGVEEGRVTALQGPIGAQPGYSIAERLRAQGLAVDDGTPEPTVILQKLQEGRLGAAAIGDSMLAQLQAEGKVDLERLEIVPTPLLRQDYFLVLSNARLGREPEAARRLWDAIRTEREARDGAPPAR